MIITVTIASRVEQEPKQKGEDGDSEDGWDKHRRNLIGQFLYGGFAALRFGNGSDDMRQHRFIAHFLRLEGKAAFAVDGAGIDLGTRLLGNGDRLSAQHFLIDKTAAADDFAIYGNTLSRLHRHRPRCGLPSWGATR